MQVFAGRSVAITGGTGALGREVVALFREAGAVCHLPVRGPAPAAGEGVRYIAGVDLTQEQAVAAFYAGLPADLWASVHLAGGFAMSPIADTSLAALREQLDQNLVTAFLCSREAIRRFRARPGGGGGRIVNVAAQSAIDPGGRAGKAAYSLAKAAVVSLTGSLGEELKDEGILVNAVAPATIDTPANRAAAGPGADLSRMASPRAIAQAILWLASPENTVVSGATLPVYGRS